MSNSGKLVLGTVQFGCQYGINSAGRPDEDMVGQILGCAYDGGIRILDTSSAYGTSEEVLGRTVPEGSSFRIVSKYPKGAGSVAAMVLSSIERLRCDGLYGYLLHHFELFADNPAIWDDFIAVRENGLAGKIGFSVYTPDELDRILESGVPFDIIQLPRNLFDRKFDSYFPELKARGVEIHVRSTFLQGLFFMDRNALPEKIRPLRKYLQALDCFAAETGSDIGRIALNFNLQNPAIDGVLIGVDNVRQMKDNLENASASCAFPDINVVEQELLNPVNWK